MPHVPPARAGCPQGRAEYQRAIDDACDALEQECHRRATGPKGSDILLMFLMKKRNPAFRDRVEHSGGVKVQHDMTFKVEFDDLITLPPRTAQPALEQHNGSNGAVRAPTRWPAPCTG